MATLSRKERRALQKMYGPQKPWAYEKQREQRRKEVLFLRDVAQLCAKHGRDFDSVTKLLMSVTEIDPDLF